MALWDGEPALQCATHPSHLFVVLVISPQTANVQQSKSCSRGDVTVAYTLTPPSTVPTCRTKFAPERSVIRSTFVLGHFCSGLPFGLASYRCTCRCFRLQSSARPVAGVTWRSWRAGGKEHMRSLVNPARAFRPNASQAALAPLAPSLYCPLGRRHHTVEVLPRPCFFSRAATKHGPLLRQG